MEIRSRRPPPPTPSTNARLRRSTFRRVRRLKGNPFRALLMWVPVLFVISHTPSGLINCPDRRTSSPPRRVGQENIRNVTSAKASQNPSAPIAYCWPRPVRPWRKAWPPWRFEMRYGSPVACQPWTPGIRRQRFADQHRLRHRQRKDRRRIRGGTTCLPYPAPAGGLELHQAAPVLQARLSRASLLR